MSVYRDTATLEKALGELFDRAVTDPDGLKELSSKRMIFLLDISEPPTLITVNGKVQPPMWAHGRTENHVNLGIHTKMDVLHQVLLKEIRLRDAFFEHKIQVDGSLFTAKRLEGLFHVLQAHYPLVLQDLQIELGEPDGQV
jgi:hypothetical protein